MRHVARQGEELVLPAGKTVECGFPEGQLDGTLAR